MKLPKFAWPRMAEWLLVAIALGAAVFFTAPPPGQYDPALWRIALHKAMLVAAGGWLGYGLDVRTSPYARPDMFLAEDWRRGLLPVVAPGEAMLFAEAMKRRAIIMGACIVAMAMGS
jgi:hypothetical protein